VKRSLTALALLFAMSGAQAFEPFQPLPATPPIPAGNPQTEAKVALGRLLYFDPRLSFTGTLSCNSCHDLFSGGDDGRPVSTGALGEAGRRSAPTLWNAAYQTVYFWDGRAPSLEAAVKEQLFSRTEMGMPNETTLVARIRAVAAYRARFAEAFDGSGITVDRIAQALSSYIRTLVTPGGPFDRYLQGDKEAVSQAALRGFDTFVETGCAACHFWVNFSGPVPNLAFRMGEGFYELFPNFIGSPYDEKYRLLEDMGRFLVTGDPGHTYMWRVPSLRNVTETAPYFHNGTVPTLEEAVRVMARTQLGKTLDDGQVADIVAFLQTLTGEFPAVEKPGLP